MLTLDSIYKASTVLNGVIRKTQLIPTQKINPEANVFLKPENLQVTGSFKVRGAGYKISQLSDEEKAHGVIACWQPCTRCGFGSKALWHTCIDMYAIRSTHLKG